MFDLLLEIIWLLVKNRLLINEDKYRYTRVLFESNVRFAAAKYDLFFSKNLLNLIH